jgi:cytochrome c-type biogenesis protein CcmH/NrfG
MMKTQIALVLALTLGIAAPAFAVGSSSGSDNPYSASSDDYQKAVRAIDAEKYQQAVSLLESVVRKDPRNADAWNYLGFGERKLEHFDKSLAAYRKALRIEPDHLGANEYLGELYLQTGKLEMAKEQLRKLEALCPGGCEEYRDLEEAIRASAGG